LKYAFGLPYPFSVVDLQDPSPRSSKLTLAIVVVVVEVDSAVLFVDVLPELMVPLVVDVLPGLLVPLALPALLSSSEQPVQST
jgi:hypothetical protein